MSGRAGRGFGWLAGTLGLMEGGGGSVDLNMHAGRIRVRREVGRGGRERIDLFIKGFLSCSCRLRAIFV